MPYMVQILAWHSLWVQGPANLVDGEEKAEWGRGKWLDLGEEVPECGSQECYLLTLISVNYKLQNARALTVKGREGKTFCHKNILKDHI